MRLAAARNVAPSEYSHTPLEARKPTKEGCGRSSIRSSSCFPYISIPARSVVLPHTCRSCCATEVSRCVPLPDSCTAAFCVQLVLTWCRVCRSCRLVNGQAQPV